MVKPYVSSCDLKLHRELDERPLPSSSILSTNAPDSPYQSANHLVGPRALNAERAPSMHEKRANGAMRVWRVCVRVRVRVRRWLSILARQDKGRPSMARLDSASVRHLSSKAWPNFVFLNSFSAYFSMILSEYSSTNLYVPALSSTCLSYTRSMKE